MARLVDEHVDDPPHLVEQPRRLPGELQRDPSHFEGDAVTRGGPDLLWAQQRVEKHAESVGDTGERADRRRDSLALDPREGLDWLAGAVGERLQRQPLCGS